MFPEDRYRERLEGIFQSLQLPIEVWGYRSLGNSNTPKRKTWALVIRAADRTPLSPALLQRIRERVQESDVSLSFDILDGGELSDSAHEDMRNHYELWFRWQPEEGRSPAEGSPGKLSTEERTALLAVLKTRFEQHSERHVGISWAEVEAKLAANPHKLWSLREMERTGGEPDVIGQDTATGTYLFCDCSKESPAGRRSLCYDREAQSARKDHPPAANAVDMAAAMGGELLTEEQYRALQEVGPFDTKTSSWIKTPGDVRKKGGALFGDFRYGRVFIYHNGASSYYSSRGFRVLLNV